MIKKTLIHFYFVCGLIFMVVGIVGIALPVLPTTPFILLAIYFFSRSSEKFHDWCLRIPGFGERIAEWQKFKIIRKRAKIQAIIIICASVMYLFFKGTLSTSVKVIALSSLALVVIFIATRPSEE